MKKNQKQNLNPNNFWDKKKKTLHFPSLKKKKKKNNVKEIS